jgi:hypothetical protein
MMPTRKLSSIKWLTVKSAGIGSIFPTFTDNADGSFDIGSCDVWLYDNTSHSGSLRQFSVTDSTGLIAPQNENSYLVVRYNNGIPIYEVIQNVDLINESTVVPILTLYNEHNVIIHAITWDKLSCGLPNKLNMRFVKTNRFGYESGLKLSADGTDRWIEVTAGIMWVGSVRHYVNAYTSQTDRLTLFAYDGTVWDSTATVSGGSWQNTEYNDINGRQPIGNGKWGANWIFQDVESEGHVGYIMGDKEYASLGDAITDNALPSNMPIGFASHGVFIGRIVFREGELTADQVDSAFEISISTGASVSVHNQLSGIQGGAVANYWHSNQPINTTNTPTFAGTNSLSKSTDSTGSIMIGAGAGNIAATENYIIAIGNGAAPSVSTGVDSICIGRDTNTAFGAIAIGAEALATSVASIAMGYQSLATTDSYGIAIGYDATCLGTWSIALGVKAHARAGNSITIGNLASTKSLTNFAIAIGSDAKTYSSSCVAIGSSAEAYVTSIGSAIALGWDATAGGNYTISLGQQAKSLFNYATTIGYLASSTNQYSISIGTLATAAQDSISIGRSSVSSDTGCIAIGYSTNAIGGSSIAIGYNAGTIDFGTDHIAIGVNSITRSNKSIAIGYNADAGSTLGLQGLAIGYNSNSNGDNSIAIGFGADSGVNTFSGGIAIGTSANSDGDNALAIGVNTTTNANNAVAIGEGTLATHVNSVQFGKDATSQFIDTFHIGDPVSPMNLYVSGDVTAPTYEGVDATNIFGDLWTDVPVSLTKSATGPTITGFVYEAIDTTTAGYAWHVPENPSNDPLMLFDIQLPHTYKAGTDIKPHLHWATEIDASSSVVVELTYSIWNVGDKVTPEAVLDATINFDATAFVEDIVSLGTIPGANLRESSIITCELRRLTSSDAADIFLGDMIWLSFDFHAQMDKRGTIAEFPGAP